MWCKLAACTTVVQAASLHYMRLCHAREGSLPQVEADEIALVADIELSAGQHGHGPALVGGYLKEGFLPISFGCRLCQMEPSVLAQDDQVAIRDQERPLVERGTAC